MFKNVDEIVVKQTRFIAVVILIGSLLMQVVFLLIPGQWNYTVLLGNLLGAAAALLNFFLMALAVVRALGLKKEDAVKYMRGSQGLRMLMLFAVCAVGAVAECFNLIAVLVPQVMPSIGARIHGMMVKDDPDHPPHALPEEDEEDELE